MLLKPKDDSLQQLVETMYHVRRGRLGIRFHSGPGAPPEWQGMH